MTASGSSRAARATRVRAFSLSGWDWTDRVLLIFQAMLALPVISRGSMKSTPTYEPR
jgi:hypothetical protein